MEHFYSAYWLRHHLQTLRQLGTSMADIQRATGLDTERLLSDPPHVRYEGTSAVKLFSLLHEHNFASTYEINALSAPYPDTHLHYAFFMNAPNVEALVNNLIFMGKFNSSAMHFKITHDANFTYIYHQFVNEERLFNTSQGHLFFIGQMIEHYVAGHRESFEAGFSAAKIPDEIGFSSTLTDKIRFKTEYSYLKIPHGLWKMSRAHTNPAVHPYLRQQFELQHRVIDDNGLLLEKVKSKITSRLAYKGKGVGIDDIAAQLGMSRSTLYRQLSRSGVNFSDLLEELRQHETIRLLQDNTLTIGQISDALGYANVTAFTRAFKRWHGVPPVLYKQRQF